MSERPAISDAKVKAATGKTPSQWFTLIERAGGQRMTHTEIARWVFAHGSPGWRSQMVTVMYEQAKKGRKLHQRPDGYEISTGVTVPLTRAAAYRAWMSPANTSWKGSRKRALRTTPKHNVVRTNWTERERVEVRFDSPRVASKTRVMVMHARLPNARAAAKAKAQWKRVLATFARRVTD
jgi:hypothetical protein